VSSFGLRVDRWILDFFFAQSRASLIKRARACLRYGAISAMRGRSSTFPLTSRSSPGRTPRRTPLAGRRSALADPWPDSPCPSCTDSWTGAGGSGPAGRCPRPFFGDVHAAGRNDNLLEAFGKNYNLGHTKTH